MRVRWTPLALSQLDRIQDYIAEENPVAAFETTEKILNQVETQLPAHPYSGRLGEHFPATRELVISNTPYIVVYRVKDETIDILRVRHGAQLWPPA